MVHSEINANASAAVGLAPRRRALWPAAFSMCFGLAVGWSTPALSNPEGGQAVAGSASIVQSSPSRLDVIQHSDKAIIDWRKFSIDPSEHTNFQQPSASAAALNRVTGGDASSILGRLTANGQVFLVNPNGVFFGRGSQVDVAGLVATTADIRNQNFLDGRYVFDKPSDNPNALVVNQGHIEVAENGFAVLAAPHVRNEGLIQARLGQVALAGANTFTLDFEGDGLLTFDVGSDVSQTPSDEDGQPVAALVSNLGTIVANGGTVVLTARAADAVVDHVINMDGVVQAQAVAVRGGEIVLSGGDSGIVKVAGDIDVSGREQGQSGGTVKVLGDKVGLFEGTHIDASGDTGGGEVLIGGNLKGKGPESNAKRTYVARNATIKADGLSQGDGGKVIVWADEVTGFNGEISARGGSKSGNGGFVEVSGKTDLSFRGEVDLTVADGDAGTLLLDPENITIVNGGGGPDDDQLDDNQILAGDSPGATFTISEAALEALPNSDVVLEATDSITIEDLADDELAFAPGPGGSITFTVNEDSSLGGGSFIMDPEDTIRASGRDVTILAGFPGDVPGIDNAAIGSIDTSNPAGGGDIAVGRDVGGPGPRRFVNITLGALDSSSSVSGNGGEIVVDSLLSLIVNEGINAGGSPDSGDITLRAEEIDLLGLAGSVRANDADLRILPSVLETDIIIGGTENTTGALDLTSNDLGALAAGFSNVIIGSSDSGGSRGQITVLGGTFDDPLTFNNPVTLAADSINLTGELQTNGNRVSMTAVDIDNTAGRLFSSSDNGSGGAITLTTQDGNIATGDLFSWATGSTGDGGDITLIVNGAGGSVDTTAGSLISTSANGTGGAITLTTGDGNIGGNISTGTLASRGDGIGDGGDITLTVDGAGGFIEVLDPTVDTFSSRSSNGNGGAITLTTGDGNIGGNILTGTLLSRGGGTGAGGDITVTIDGSTGSINTTPGFLAADSEGGGGAITLTTGGGDISTANVFSLGSDSASAGGDITVTIDGPTGSIDTTAGQQLNSAARGVGGAITLSTQSGDITTNRIESGGFGGVGGAITLSTQGGNISTTALISVGGSGGTNAGGDITLTIDGPTGSINTTAEGLLQIDSSSFFDVGGAITLRTEDGNINVNNQILSNGQVNGGEISIVSSSGSISIADQILATGVDGVGGAVILETNGGITAAAINSTGGAGSGDISLFADEINLSGSAGSVQGANASLSLQPFTSDLDIIIGDGGDPVALNLTSQDLNALADGFLEVVVGSSELGGSAGQMTVAGATFNDPVSLLANVITVDGELQTNGNALSVKAQDIVDINADIRTTGGAINIAGSTITTTGSVLNSIPTAGPSGDIRLESAGSIDTSGGTLNTASDSGSGDITLIADSGAITVGELSSSSDLGEAGTILLKVPGDITTIGNIFASSAISGTGGDIILLSGGAIDTTAGELNTISVQGEAGAILLDATGDISAGDIFASSINLDGIGNRNTEGSGGIALSSVNGNISTGGLLSPTQASFGSAGSSKGITVTANNGSITTNGLVWAFSSAAVDGGAGNSGDGGEISLSAKNDINIVGSIQTGARSDSGNAGNGGAVSITSTDGSIIMTDTISSSSRASGTSGDGGAIIFDVSDNITTGGFDSRSDSGQGGKITLDTAGAVEVGGPIQTNNNEVVLTAGDSVDVNANITTTGGAIDISSGGSIDTTAGVLSSGSSGDGADITLIALTSIATGSIDTNGSTGSGNIDLMGDEINLLGGDSSVQSQGALSLRPFTPAQDIFIGGDGDDTNTEILELTATDLDALRGGFASIAIGRNDGSGTISIDPAGISLNDPLILQSPATGGIIVANGPMQTTGSLRATAATIGLQDVTTNDFQNYTGSVTFNSDYVTDGGSFTVEGDSTLASNTRVTTDGGDVLFGALEGPGALSITAGSGDILFQGDVGTQIPLGPVSVASAQNISLTGQFVAGPSEFFYDGSLTSPDPSLEVESLFIDPDATSARLFGSVGGDSGREAALAVAGPSDDPDFTINGFVMGTSEPEVLAESEGPTAAEPNTDTAEQVAVAKQDVFVAEEPSPERTEIGALETTAEPDPVRFPPKFNMSNFTMNATIKGGWPVVVDYQLERLGEVRVNIAVEGVEHFTFELDGTTTDRMWDVVTVPKRFGVRVKPASITVRASEQGGTKAVPLHLYGLGAGRKAVGSVAIDSILFGPTRISTFFGETAAYRFRSRSDFDTVKVDFCKVTDTAYEDTNESVHTHDIEQGISGDDWIGLHEPRIWNGRDRNNAVSSGLHKLQVRAWDKPGEWVTAWSDSLLDVSE